MVRGRRWKKSEKYANVCIVVSGACVVMILVEGDRRPWMVGYLEEIEDASFPPDCLVKVGWSELPVTSRLLTLQRQKNVSLRGLLVGGPVKGECFSEKV